jgi:hypothetical protein
VRIMVSLNGMWIGGSHAQVWDAQGKSQRRWQMLHALHLIALRDMIKRHYRKRSRQRTGVPAYSQGSGQMGTPLNSEEASP